MIRSSPLLRHCRRWSIPSKRTSAPAATCRFRMQTSASRGVSSSIAYSASPLWVKRTWCAYSKHQMRAIVESWRSWRVFSVGRPAGSDDSTATPFHSFVFADRSRPARHRFDSSGAPRLIIPCAHCGVLLIFSHFFPRAPTPSVRCPSLALNSGVSCCPRKAEFNAIVLNEVRVR